MGHEGTGMVAQLGSGITADTLGTPIKEGDRVVYSAVFPCYHCHLCLRGDTNWCVNRTYPAAGVYPYFTGTYADYLYLPPRHPFFRVPDELPNELLGPVNCAMGTVTTGLLPFHTLISHKFPLAQVNEACEKAEWNQRQTEITRAVLVP